MNDYYNAPSDPANYSVGRSSTIRAQFAGVAAGFDLLPDPDEIAEGRATYAVDTGVANAMLIDLPTRPAAYTAGMSITFKAAATNTGATTVNVQGPSGMLGAKSVLRSDGTALQAGDLVANQIGQMVYDGTSFRLPVVFADMSAAGVAAKIAVAGNIGVVGSLTVQHTAGPSFTIQDSDTAGLASSMWAQFLDSSATRYGYFGKASLSNSDIYLNADLGKIKLAVASAIIGEIASTGFTVTGTLTASSNLLITGGSFPTLVANQALLYGSATLGAVLAGYGSTNDVTITNRAGSSVLNVPTGTIEANFPGVISAAGINLTNSVSVVKLSQESASLSRLSAYGANAATQGSLQVRTVSSDGSASNIVATFTSAGLAVAGLLDVSAASSGQIKFPATQNPSADVNTLDDYEEGTFTPGLQFGGAAVGMTFSVQSGRYTKVGRLVTVDVSLTLTAKGSSTGVAQLVNLPFAPAVAPPTPAGAWLGTNLTTVAFPAFTVDSASTTISLWDFTGSSRVALTEGDFTNTSQIYLSATYSI